MKILGIESSCDETACAVVEDGRKILSNVVATQIPFHQIYKGVVPEIASRKHAEWILPVVSAIKQKELWPERKAISDSFRSRHSTVRKRDPPKVSSRISAVTPRDQSMAKSSQRDSTTRLSR